MPFSICLSSEACAKMDIIILECWMPLYINNFAVCHANFILIQFRLQVTDEIPIYWLFS